jgi:hypothetical protein
MKFVFFYILFLNFTFASEVLSTPMKKSIIGVRYFSRAMGNVHQNPSRYSLVLTTISCNHPDKAMKETSADGKDFILYAEDKWNLVTVGPYEGYIMTEYLTDKKNECFEEEYSKFYDGLNLGVNELYYWARLYDQYVLGKSQVHQ